MAAEVYARDCWKLAAVCVTTAPRNLNKFELRD